MNRSPRQATLVRRRTGRLLLILMIMCSMIGCLFIIGGISSPDVSGELMGVAVTIILLNVPIGLVRSFYLAVRRNQVTHVLLRDE